MEKFKVGDNVMIEITTNACCMQRFSKVTEITKAGNIRVESESGLFKPDGCSLDGSEWLQKSISLISKEQSLMHLQMDEFKRTRSTIIKYLNQLYEMPSKDIFIAIKALHVAIQEKK